MQAAALVKLGLLLWTSPKAFFGGACGQDWVWLPDSVLITKSTQLQRVLCSQASDIEKVSQLITSLAGNVGRNICSASNKEIYAITKLMLKKI